ncbi:hypothetical protein M0P65_01590 [Candidatus Gracilibacteria bacterium]|nr:hypothetical protein [Candidatus Gracilibacteria bacterium]
MSLMVEMNEKEQEQLLHPLPEHIREHSKTLNIHGLVKEIENTKAHIAGIEEGHKEGRLVKRHEVGIGKIHLGIVSEVHKEVDGIIRGL